jgi:hypothetical protein
MAGERKPPLKFSREAIRNLRKSVKKKLIIEKKEALTRGETDKSGCSVEPKRREVNFPQKVANTRRLSEADHKLIEVTTTRRKQLAKASKIMVGSSLDLVDQILMSVGTILEQDAKEQFHRKKQLHPRSRSASRERYRSGTIDSQASCRTNRSSTLDSIRTPRQTRHTRQSRNNSSDGSKFSRQQGQRRSPRKTRHRQQSQRSSWAVSSGRGGEYKGSHTRHSPPSF